MLLVGAGAGLDTSARAGGWGLGISARAGAWCLDMSAWVDTGTRALVRVRRVRGPII